MTPLSVIFVIALLIVVFMSAYVRSAYPKTLSIMGPTGWKYAFSSAYLPLGYFFDFFGGSKSPIAPSVTYWLENYPYSNSKQAEFIENMLKDNSCNATQSYKCILAGYSDPTPEYLPPCSACEQTGSVPTESTGSKVVNGIFRYGVPIIGLALMAL